MTKYYGFKKLGEFEKEKENTKPKEKEKPSGSMAGLYKTEVPINPIAACILYIFGDGNA